MSERVQVLVYLDEDLKRSLKLCSVQTGKSVSAIVREAVRSYIKKQSKSMFDDKALAKGWTWDLVYAFVEECISDSCFGSKLLASLGLANELSYGGSKKVTSKRLLTLPPIYTVSIPISLVKENIPFESSDLSIWVEHGQDMLSSYIAEELLSKDDFVYCSDLSAHCKLIHQSYRTDKLPIWVKFYKVIT